MRGLDPYDAAVTGMGWIASVGCGAGEVWRALCAGASGVRRLEAEGAPPGTRLGAPVEGPRLRTQVLEDQETQTKFLNPSSELVATAVGQAVREAGLVGGRIAPERRALYVAQLDLVRAQCLDFRSAVLEATAGGTRPLDAQALNQASLSRVNPFVLLETLHNNAFSFLASNFGLRGANTTLSGWEGPGLSAVSLAARSVRSRRAEAAVAGGAGATVRGPARVELAKLGLASPSADPAGAPRPFDRRRDGLVCGDGGAALVLEPLAVARTRGPGPFAVVVGQGGATGRSVEGDLFPEAESLVAAGRAALREAGLRTSELLGVVAPASGRRIADRVLLEALRELLGGASVPVVATAGSLGHAAVASDVGHVLLAAHALREGLLPGCAGFSEPEPGFEDVRVTQKPEAGSGAAVLVLSAGADGQAQGLVVARVR